MNGDGMDDLPGTVDRLPIGIEGTLNMPRERLVTLVTKPLEIEVPLATDARARVPASASA